MPARHRLCIDRDRALFPATVATVVTLLAGEISDVERFVDGRKPTGTAA
jgi:hypothetical protein